MMIGQRDPLKRLGDRALLGRKRFEEFEPRRSVEKELANFDSSPGRDRARASILDVAGLGRKLDSLRIDRAPGEHPQMRHARDGRERLAAKAERADRAQVGGSANF